MYDVDVAVMAPGTLSSCTARSKPLKPLLHSAVPALPQERRLYHYYYTKAEKDGGWIGSGEGRAAAAGTETDTGGRTQIAIGADAYVV
jgi:hypothetical protein